jgi:hypothetical protein
MKWVRLAARFFHSLPIFAAGWLACQGDQFWGVGVLLLFVASALLVTVGFVPRKESS